jgi:hypothetical protein
MYCSGGHLEFPIDTKSHLKQGHPWNIQAKFAPRVDCVFDPSSGETKDFRISNWCFSAKHGALRSKNSHVEYPKWTKNQLKCWGWPMAKKFFSECMLTIIPLRWLFLQVVFFILQDNHYTTEVSFQNSPLFCRYTSLIKLLAIFLRTSGAILGTLSLYSYLEIKPASVVL